MEDIGLVNQGWRWLQSQKHVWPWVCSALQCFGEKTGALVEFHWPVVCSGFEKLLGLLHLSFVYWKDCIVRGFQSSANFGSAALLVIMWSCFLSLTSMSCLLYVLLSMVAAGAVVLHLGCTPGIFIVGLFGILILWMYANFWITGILSIVGGYLFSLNHARVMVLMAMMYAIYCVKIRLGWLGVILAMNLAFLSNDILICLLQWYDNVSEKTQTEEPKKSKTVIEEEFSEEFEYSSIPVEEPVNKVHENKSSTKAASPSTVFSKVKEISSVKVVKIETDSYDEMKRILRSLNHYDALGFPRNKKIDADVLKKEYRKKAMLVHPDKNMGSPLASESFKKLQCAYEVLSDSVKKRDYDEKLKRKNLGPEVFVRNHTLLHIRLVQIIEQKSQGVYTVPNAVIPTYGCVPTGARQRLDGVRIVVNFIKLKMVMDGLNIKGLWDSGDHIRLKFPELLSVRRARSLTYQNGLYVRVWHVDQTHIGQVSM